jgi:hypothetical protein
MARERTREKSRAWSRFGLLIGSVSVFLALVLPTQGALATFHLVSISEVYAGSAAHPQSSFVELQMYEAGQNFVGNNAVVLYDSAGNTIGTFPFKADLPGSGANQQTMLIGDDEVQATFGVMPDLVDAGFNVPASGGAACWAGSIDCVAWGDFHGSTPSPSGVPADSPGIADGTALVRRISGGTCSNLLDAADDSDDSDTDFAAGPPSPQSYATVPAPMSCTPTPPLPSAVIDSQPPAATNSPEASFAFHSSPPGATLECRLDGAAYKDCSGGTATYAGPLSEALHTFQVRASNANGVGAATKYAWLVDVTPPTASITSHPADPSPGKSASFRYSSSQGGSKFECRLSPLESAFTPCDTQPKVYSSLANGKYTFEVLAIDPAGNIQPAPTPFEWTVNNSLLDTTPPETSIATRPPDPSSSSSASFTYTSNEPGSTFECKIDSGGFLACPATGITYTGLGDGAHTFQARAIDPSHNTDPTPAGYSFQVVLSAAPLGAVQPAPTPRRPHVETVISAKPKGFTHDRTPTFRFRAGGTGASFQCKLDAKPFQACRSPFTTKTLSYGKHTLQVRAIVAGATDSSPAKFSFVVKA